MVICPACRAKNPTGALTCRSCNAELKGRAAPMRRSGDDHPQPEPAPNPDVDDLLPVVPASRGASAADVSVRLEPAVEERVVSSSVADQLALVPTGDDVSADAGAGPPGARAERSGEGFERDSRGVRWFGPPEGDGSVAEVAPVDVAIERKGPRRPASVRGMPPQAQRPAAPAAPARHEALDLEPPKLGDMPALPDVIETLRLGTGIAGRMRYAMQLGAAVERQRAVLRRLGAALARLRRDEVACVEVLGRATRKLGLTPPDLAGAADAAGLEERAVESRMARADERHREQREAEEVYETVRSAAELRLAEIEGRYAPLAARRRELERRFAAAAGRVDELRARERELEELAAREPTDEELGGEIRLENERIVVTRRNRDEEVARREAEHGACRLELVAAERELKETGTRLQATRGPLEKAEAEMAKLRASMGAALEQLHAAEDQARAAAVAGRRRADFANRTAAELDREIGAAVLGRLTQHELEPELEPFVAAVEKARERVRRVEARLNAQHDQLEAADEGAARAGARAIALFAALVVVVLAGIAWALSAIIGSG